MKRKSTQTSSPNEKAAKLHQVSFRPTVQVRNYLDSLVDSGEASNMADAINRSVEVAQRTKEQIRNEIIAEFGGAHNFKLGYVCARTARGVEDLHQELWTEDIPTFLNVQSAIKDVLRYYFSVVKKFKSFDPKNDWNIRFWAYTAIAISMNVQNGRRLWWPLGQSSSAEESAEEVDQIGQASSAEEVDQTKFVPSALVIDFPEKSKRLPNPMLKLPLRFIELLWHADRQSEAVRIELLNSFEKVADIAEERQLDINTVSDKELIDLVRQKFPKPKNEMEKIKIEETNRQLDAAFRSRPKKHEKSSAQQYEQLVI